MDAKEAITKLNGYLDIAENDGKALPALGAWEKMVELIREAGEAESKKS